MGFMKRAKEQMAQGQAATQQAAQMQQGIAAGMGGMPGPGEMQATAAMSQKLNRLAQVGMEAPGTIKGLLAVGSPDISGGTMHNIDVNFQPSGGGEAVDTTIQQSLLPAQIQGLSAGMACVVKYDPADPTQAIVHSW